MHSIHINGKRLDPKDAARIALPLDTALACPACSGTNVQTKAALVTERLVLPQGIEHSSFVPRMRDGWCLDCGHQWASVLPPESYSNFLIRR